jgi:hypothetical protein
VARCRRIRDLDHSKISERRQDRRRRIGRMRRGIRVRDMGGSSDERPIQDEMYRFSLLPADLGWRNFMFMAYGCGMCEISMASLSHSRNVWCLCGGMEA